MLWRELGHGEQIDPQIRHLEPMFGEDARLSFRSQVWQGIEWRHDLILVKPSWSAGVEGAYFEITGDDVGRADVDYARDLAEISGVPVVVLFSIPNQPLWEMREDDLIAHTFEKFIESGDQSWPLLVPMVRAANRGLEIARSEFGIEKYVAGGGSKRGWTSWLLAASRPDGLRGIVPIVFDNLGMAQQVHRQIDLWGTPSEQIGDYTRRQLHELAINEEGKELTQIVDPLIHIADSEVPALIINGANDPYWVVDALTHYYCDLPAQSSQVVVPNLPHALGERHFWGPGFARFIQAMLSDQEISVPNFQSSYQTAQSESLVLGGLATTMLARLISGRQHQMISCSPNRNGRNKKAFREVTAEKLFLTKPTKIGLTCSKWNSKTMMASGD
ncbi:MAG: PhoPQ-activated protein PqaA family protein [Fimbriimonadaceae bacterium]